MFFQRLRKANKPQIIRDDFIPYCNAILYRDDDYIKDKHGQVKVLADVKGIKCDREVPQEVLTGLAGILKDDEVLLIVPSKISRRLKF